MAIEVDDESQVLVEEVKQYKSEETTLDTEEWRRYRTWC